MVFRTFILLFTLPIVAQADVDFSNYDVPLYTQIVDRIKAKVSDRLGEGSNTRERYFIIPFAYQDRGNHPEFSHSFISVIRVLADNKQPKLTPDLKLRRYRNREFEAFTISWRGRRLTGRQRQKEGEMYGTVARMVVKPENREKMRAVMEGDTRKVPVAMGSYTLQENDSDNVWLLAIFEDKATYDANADDPAMNETYGRSSSRTPSGTTGKSSTRRCERSGRPEALGDAGGLRV